MPSIQQAKQVIDSLLQNFDWETSPNWPEKLDNIKNHIQEYWDVYLQRKTKSK
jgi:hypothetical protein